MIINEANPTRISKKLHHTEIEKRRAMSWAQRLRRAFSIDIEICERCSGRVKIVACIEQPEVINKILAHLITNKSAQIH
jgi:hypothetical protein